MSTALLEPPWYKQFWPWILIALPASAVIACAITLWLVLQAPDREIAHESQVNQVMGKSSVVPPKQ
jgi:hypothetical protein